MDTTRIGSLMRSSSRMALAVALLLGAAACESSTGTPDPFRLTVTPEGPVDLFVGDTLTLRATEQGGGRVAVTFAVVGAGVLEVGTNGLVTALTPGEATVTATSVEHPGAKAEVLVRVASLGLASVDIQSVLRPVDVPIDPAAVRGVMDVVVSFERGDAARLDVLVDTVVACSEPLVEEGEARSGVVALQSRVVTRCEVDTAAFDPLTGIPVFHNGPAVVSARLVGPGDAALDSVTWQTITLVNPNGVHGRLTASRAAPDLAGVQWFGGDVRAQAFPVLYDPTSTLERVTFTYVLPQHLMRQHVDSVPPFEVVFAESELEEAVDQNFRIRLATVATNGRAGPDGFTPGLRYDNGPPNRGTFVAREWVGAATAFSGSFAPGQDGPEGGTNVFRVEFFAGDPSVTADEIVEGGVPVVRGADLAPGPTGSYRLVARTCDALDNCVAQAGFVFGVDLEAPTVEGVNLEDRAVNPDADLVAALGDDLSGTATPPLQVRVRSLNASPAADECGPEVEGMDLPGKMVGESCAADTTGVVVPVPRATAGYYEYALTPLDRAGNAGTTVVRTLLVDLTPPSIARVDLPAQLTPGAEASFGVEATDDLDLVGASFRLTYPAPGGGTLDLPFAPPVALGVGFDDTLTRSKSGAAKMPFVRVVTQARPGSRSVALVDSVRVQVSDGAGLTAVASRAIPPSLYGGNTSTSDPFAAITSVSTTPNTGSVTLCSSEEECLTGDALSSTLTVRLTGAPGEVSTPTKMYFFRQRRGAGTIELLDVVDLARIDDSGTQRTFTYSYVFAPTGGLSGDFDVLAVAVTESGSAFQIAFPTVFSLVRR